MREHNNLIKKLDICSILFMLRKRHFINSYDVSLHLNLTVPKLPFLKLWK